MQEISIRNFIIVASNKVKVERQLDKLNRRTNKLGLYPIDYVFGKAYINNNMLMLPVEVAGPLEVKFNGWEFIATIQHLDTGDNIIRKIKDIDIPERFRNTPKNCDHCNINRYRKDTYIVYNKEFNQFCQVGSTCITDFLGGNSPDYILQLASIIADMNSFINHFGIGSDHDMSYHINDILADTKAIIREFGWVPKYKANEFIRSTASRVLDFCITPSEEDRQFASKACEWAENLTDEDVKSSDYLFNIRSIVRSGIVNIRTIGYAASIISAYEKTINNTKFISNHLGIIKEKKTFKLKVTASFVFDGMYGTSYKYIFTDEHGNIVTWNTTNCQDFDKECLYIIEGTIKSHVEYKGVLQTELTRCKIKAVFKNGKMV